MNDVTALGFSKDRLRRLDEFMQSRYVASGRFPGVQVLIARGGEIAHSSVLGLRDVERGLPVEDDTIFRIYSMTKPVTSLAFMMLVEEGLVALDDPVAKFIPQWRDLQVFAAGGPVAFRTRPTARPMQIVDLLRHTSGLTYGIQNRTNLDAAYRGLHLAELGYDDTLDDMIEALAALPLEFSPGEAWNYSVATDVLGYLVGKISGVPFDQFLQRRIFDPLGMVDTGFHVPADKASRFAACYSATPEGGLALQDDPVTSPYLKPATLLSGGGGLVSTSADYLRFCRMLARGGELDGARLVAPMTLALMRANHLPGGRDLAEMSQSLFSEATNAGMGFGLGFAVVEHPARTLIPCSVGEYFWGGAASTAFWIDPVEDLIVIQMTQVLPSSAYPIRRELRTLVYSAMMERRG
ncbi:serine hydrolase [Phenylobacterium sp.]|uniref:serine hydrolase domain-containing protein n=1 Tax=Phenylobacterium sp. TaxID=1871053 RepID=UPI0027358863|nr:serine hydrolase domain-containing protein [Phenylobacterium sp.]MDP3660510.1 serine hydrolase domain-containing protein [Phenylobacterium sp.]